MISRTTMVASKRLFDCHTVVLIGGALLVHFTNGQPERDYEVFLESYRCVPLPNLTIYLGDATGLRYKKINHSVHALIGSFELGVQLDDTFTFSSHLYLKMGNEYKESFAPMLDKNVCEFMESDTYVFPDLVAASDLPPKCPYLGKYTVRNYVINTKKFPIRMLPGKEWKCVIFIYRGGELIAEFQVFVRIEYIM